MKMFSHFRSVLASVVISSLTLSSIATAQTAPTVYTGLDGGIHSLIVKLTIKPERVEEFLKLMRARIQQSRGEAAVVDFRILASADPTVFYGFESFRSKAAFEAFAKSPESLAFLERLKDLQSQPGEVHFLKPLP